MKDAFFQELRDELRQGVGSKEHPFRYCTMGTVGLDRMARLRTVVLRNVSEDLSLTFYTDARSKKIIHIKENNKVSLLFYHPKKLLQIKIEGPALVNKDAPIPEKYLTGAQEGSMKDYTTTLAPGSTISAPDSVEYLEAGANFCTIEVRPFKIEYLKLKRPNHLRVRYSMEEGAWESEFLVP